MGLPASEGGQEASLELGVGGAFGWEDGEAVSSYGKERERNNTDMGGRERHRDEDASRMGSSEAAVRAFSTSDAAGGGQDAEPWQQSMLDGARTSNHGGRGHVRVVGWPVVEGHRGLGGYRLCGLSVVGGG